MVGLDIAKHVFQAHGADSSGAVVFRKRLRRDQVMGFFAGLPRCVVALEACGGAHFWARALQALGHEAKLLPPAYVKPFVKRQKNDTADAEAICEASVRPTMRFAVVRSEAAQAAALVFRTRDLLVGQRTAAINALRGHLAEFGLVVAKGPANVAKLVAMVEDPASGLPEAARRVLAVLAAELGALAERIAVLDREIARRARTDETARRLMTIPGIGPVTATALAALAPDAGRLRRGRDFSAWLGLVPVQRSSGGRERLGRTSRKGERTLRRLLIIGASAVVRWARRGKGSVPSAWLEGLIGRKPPMLVAVALANKTARIAWALLAHGGVYQAPRPAAA